MFDTLYIDTDKLPITQEEKALIGKNPGWQTKSLDCLMRNIYITNDNLLKVTDDHHYSNDAGNNIHLIEVYSYTGDIEFYSDIKEYWYSFIASFKNGKLITIIGGKESYSS